MNYLEYVNPRQGTNSDFYFSTGNTLPLVARPFGMTHWTPQTRAADWLYHAQDRHFRGIRATHQPSPWMRDYGHLSLMPMVADLITDPNHRASSFRQIDEIIHPNYFSVFLRRYGIQLELTPTERCAVLRLTFPIEATPYLLLQPDKGAFEIDRKPAERRILICTHDHEGGVPDNFGCYFVIEAACDFSAAGDAGVAFAQGGEVTLKIGTSFISYEQARLNIWREIGDHDFDTIRAEGENVWHLHLSRIEIEPGNATQAATFYTALYRSLLFPRQFHEYGEHNQPYHYSPYDGQIYPGVLYTDNGFWDTHRTVYSLLSILYPDRLGEILEGWLNAYREGGWLPKWASPGYRDCMISTHIDVIFADAIVKGVAGFDVETAYAAIHQNATQPTDNGAYGRVGLDDYMRLGYVPADKYIKATSRTLDFAYCDWGIGQVASLLGKTDDAELFSRRALNYRNCFDSKSGFMRGRHEDGSWQAPFDPLRWGGAFVEGNAWQFTWNVPHDPQDLIALMGGREAFIGKLTHMLTQPSVFHVGTYGQEIHEMSEMAAIDFGQYAHCNQPVHHVLYLFTLAGVGHLTQHWIHRVLTELYTVDTLPGDEDNGEMSAWYVLSSLGVYPLCLGSGDYILNSSLFRSAQLHLPDEKVFTLLTADTEMTRLNDVPHPVPTLRHETLVQGGILVTQPPLQTQQSITSWRG